MHAPVSCAIKLKSNGTTHHRPITLAIVKLSKEELGAGKTLIVEMAVVLVVVEVEGGSGAKL